MSFIKLFGNKIRAKDVVNKTGVDLLIWKETKKGARFGQTIHLIDGATEYLFLCHMAPGTDGSLTYPFYIPAFLCSNIATNNLTFRFGGYLTSGVSHGMTIMFDKTSNYFKLSDWYYGSSPKNTTYTVDIYYR